MIKDKVQDKVIASSNLEHWFGYTVSFSIGAGLAAIAVLFATSHVHRRVETFMNPGGIHAAPCATSQPLPGAVR